MTFCLTYFDDGISLPRASSPQCECGRTTHYLNPDGIQTNQHVHLVCSFPSRIWGRLPRCYLHLHPGSGTRPTNHTTSSSALLFKAFPLGGSALCCHLFFFFLCVCVDESRCEKQAKILIVADILLFPQPLIVYRSDSFRNNFMLRPRWRSVVTYPGWGRYINEC